MKARAKLLKIDTAFTGDRARVLLEIKANPADLEELYGSELDVDLSIHRNKRSLRANACLWACLGDLAGALGVKTWSLYLYELQCYGKYTYILSRQDALPSLRKQWRETRVVGETEALNPETGEYERMAEVLCFFGSSTYNSKEFSRLLDGVISDMKAVGLPGPVPEDVAAIIADMEEAERNE